MIRNNIIAVTILLAVLVLNGLAILRVNQRYTEYRNQTLLSQSRLCGEHMETTLLQFSSDINQEVQLYSSEIFKNPEKFREATQSLRLFYTKYRDLVTKISVYDNQKNFYALYLEPGDDSGKEDAFVVDSFATRRQKPLSPVEDLEQNGSNLEYYYPFFGQDVVIGNVAIELDLKQFTDIVFKLYPKSSNMSWQWILDTDGKVIIDDFGADSFLIESIAILTDSVNAEASGMVEHNLKNENGKRIKVYTAYYPLSIYERKMGVMFSTGRGQIFKYYLQTDGRIKDVNQC